MTEKEYKENSDHKSSWSYLLRNCILFFLLYRSLLTGGLSGAGSASGAGASGPGITPGGMGCNCNCNYNQVSPAATSGTGRGYDTYGPGYGWKHPHILN